MGKLVEWFKKDALNYVLLLAIALCFAVPTYVVALKMQDASVFLWVLALAVALVFLKYMRTYKSLYVCLLNGAITAVYILAYPHQQPYLFLGSLAFIVVIRIGESFE